MCNIAELDRGDRSLLTRFLDVVTSLGFLCRCLTPLAKAAEAWASFSQGSMPLVHRGLDKHYISLAES